MQVNDTGIALLRISGTLELDILRTEAVRTPVLFLHGYTSGAWQFAKYVMPALAEQGFDCWALNLRGHGGSGGRDMVRKARFSDYASDVARAMSFVEQTTGKTPTLIGHSLGSVLARDDAARHNAPGLALVSFGDIKLGERLSGLVDAALPSQGDDGHDDWPPVGHFQRVRAATRRHVRRSSPRRGARERRKAHGLARQRQGVHGARQTHLRQPQGCAVDLLNGGRP